MAIDDIEDIANGENGTDSLDGDSVHIRNKNKGKLVPKLGPGSRTNQTMIDNIRSVSRKKFLSTTAAVKCT